MVEMSNVWDRTAEFISDNLASILPIALLTIFVPTSISTNLWDAMANAPAAARLVMAVVNLALVLVFVWGELVLIGLALDLGDEHQIRANALRRLPGVVLIAVIGVVFSLVLAMLCGVILYVMGTPPSPGAMSEMTPEAAARAGGALAQIALGIVPIGTWVYARFFLLTTPVIVNEGGSLGAFGRAFRLTRGATLKTIGVLVLYVIVSIVAVLAAQLVFGSIFRLAAGGGGQALSLSSVLTSIVVAAVQTGFVVLAQVFTAKLYQALVYSHATKTA
jgi:hypothetical protein